MADQVTVINNSGNPGTDYVVSTDDAGASGQVQRVKIAYSADGSATHVSADALGLLVNTGKPSTATRSDVNDSAANQTLLAANSSRMGASIFNDSSSILYVKLGTTATTTDFSVKLFQDGYYEVPFGYTGRIDGIWSADSTGAARITELTA